MIAALKGGATIGIASWVARPTSGCQDHWGGRRPGAEELPQMGLGPCSPDRCGRRHHTVPALLASGAGWKKLRAPSTGYGGLFASPTGSNKCQRGLKNTCQLPFPRATMRRPGKWVSKVSMAFFSDIPPNPHGSKCPLMRRVSDARHAEKVGHQFGLSIS